MEAYNPPTLPATSAQTTHADLLKEVKTIDPWANLKGKKIAWVGDTNNIINEIMVTMPRLGMEVSVASPKGYDQVDERVWKRVYVSSLWSGSDTYFRVAADLGSTDRKQEAKARSTARHRQKRLFRAPTWL